MSTSPTPSLEPQYPDEVARDVNAFLAREEERVRS
jgi:hypothetical protein